MRKRSAVTGLFGVVLAACSVGFSASAAAQGQSDRRTVAVAHRAGAAADVRAAVLRAGGRVVQDMAVADALIVELPARAIAALERNSRVEFVDSGAPRTILGGRSVRSSHLPVGETVPYGITMVQADQVGDGAAGNRIACIVDSGVDGAHPDLAGVAMTGTNFTRSGDWNTDENSHGTHVAGTMVAVDNSIGVVGVAPNAKLRLHIVKVFDASGSASSITISRGMLDCWLNGSHVVNMSLGGAGASPMERRIAQLLHKKGLLQIAAAGNAGTNTVSYPAGFPEVVSVAGVDSSMNLYVGSQWNPDVEIAAPAVAVLSTVPAFSQIGASVDVGATSYPAAPMEGSPLASATGELANFGLGDTVAAGSMSGKVCLISRGVISFGQKVLNCEASGGVGAIIYNNVPGDLFGTLGTTVTSIPSVGTTQADGAAMLGQLGQTTTVAVLRLPDQYAYYSGTSMAAPHVSGVAAVVWSLHPGCTAEQIRTSLNRSALDLGDTGRDEHFGYGLVQAKAADTRLLGGCGQ
jgi:subtilisin family serine protease